MQFGAAAVRGFARTAEPSAGAVARVPALHHDPARGSGPDQPGAKGAISSGEGSGEMRVANLTEPSDSPWAAPVVMVLRNDS